MTRRLPALVLAVVTVLLVAPARLNGDPSPTASASSSTTDPLGLPTTEGHKPLTLFPRRPGAKYEESEASSTEALSLAFSRLRITKWAIIPKSARPAGFVAADRKRYERADLVDGYAPSTTTTTGDLLHVVVNVTQATSRDPLICAATLADNGTVLVPYARDTTKPRAATSTATSEPDPSDAPIDVDVDLYFPIGAHRGRVFVTCESSLFPSLDNPSLFGGPRPVWGIDV